MILALSLFAIVVLILFVLTWYNISTRADANQYAQTCGHIDDDRRKLRELVRNHEGYGPLQQHIAALDQVVTLQLQTPPDGAESYFSIPSPEQYKVCYAACEGGLGRNSTERSVTLRELLNRVLKDIPVELVHPVEADWKFADAPMPAPSIGIHLIQPPYVVDIRKSPLEPRPAATPSSLFEALGLVPKPIVFSPHSCGLDGLRFNDHN